MLNRIFPGLLGLLFAGSAVAADLSGIWTGTLTDRNGDPQDLSFRFTQKGESLTGKMYGDNESTTIMSGSVVSNQITFRVTTELNGQISTFVFSGSGTGDQMDLSRTRVEPVAKVTAVPAKEAAKPAQPQTFHLKRLT